ncbi:unnamed protein product, partial [Iphiclides podalirius]
MTNSTMSETASENSVDSEKPVQLPDDVIFPPFPEPTDDDFEEDITEEERNYYRDKFKDLNTIKTQRLHCSACDRHLGCATRNESRMRPHPMLRTLVCHTCHTFYNSGEFEKGDDGSELYCRWCGQGGQVYCCSDCPHVFCARCIRRNLGTPKIKEIEQADDWKCFKCNPKCLWDLRAICWAVLRYCDQKNKIAYNTQDPELKETYQKDCAVDYSECCKNKTRRKEKPEVIKKKEAETAAKKTTASIISKISPAIQVKKFASINPDDRQERKPQKRPASPKNKTIFIKNPIAISGPSSLNPMNLPTPQPKKIRMTPPPMMNTVRFNNERKQNPVIISRFKPKPSGIPILSHSNQFNGFNNTSTYSNVGSNDNINLSLDNLTQGLDMAAVAAMSSGAPDDDVVCTPDLPLEPLCEMLEENADDDVQCITPGPVAAPKAASQLALGALGAMGAMGPMGALAQLAPLPPLAPRALHAVPDLTPENIVQMTENDVTVNAATGGLKFRVDPQTLSSNKMYRLPDGRVFAINANPAMPGGYSATIVAVTETAPGRAGGAPKGATYAAKLSAVGSPPAAGPPPLKSYGAKAKPRASPRAKVHRGTDASARECDLSVPVEWFRYNLIDAVDALEYSLSRLHKLKKEATTMYLRTRSLGEMRNLHRSLDRLLSTSVARFNEVRDNIGKEMKQYVSEKMGLANNNNNNTSEDDDDVEILPDMEENDDPIFIDENSVESSAIESQEVDLTGASEHNNSSDKSMDRADSAGNITADCLNMDAEDANIVSADVSISNFAAFSKELSGQAVDHNNDTVEESGDKNESDGSAASGSKVTEKEVNGELSEASTDPSAASGEQSIGSPLKSDDTTTRRKHHDDKAVTEEAAPNKVETEATE